MTRVTWLVFRHVIPENVRAQVALTFLFAAVFDLHVVKDVHCPVELRKRIVERKLVAEQPLRKLEQVVELLPLIGWTLQREEVNLNVMTSPVHVCNKRTLSASMAFW